MASLQARHSRTCELGKAWTPFTGAAHGCTCPDGPTYYVVVREGGRVHRERAGKNRRQAQRVLTKIQSTVDDGEFRPQPNVTFSTWADRWLASLERKRTTRRAYAQSIGYAKSAFGDKAVRRLRAEDIARLNVSLRERGLSASTRNRHLRALHTCLQSAVRHGYAARNPVAELPPGEKPRAEHREAAYFTNEELPRLFAEIPDGIYKTLFLAALKTGMREGELCALTWGDVDLAGAVVRVRRSYTDGHLTDPKNHERRDVDLTPEVVELLGWWWGECGRPGDACIVFSAGSKSGYLSPTAIVSRQLHPAMDRAGVPRVGPTGERRVFHSFRHTFAKRALERGAQITWLSRHLGHSSITVTDSVYGHWERAERKRQNELLRDAFGV